MHGHNVTIPAVQIIGAIVVPAYNEADGLAGFLLSLRHVLLSIVDRYTHISFKIYVVDDGSDDGTLSVAESVRGAIEVSTAQSKTISLEVIPLLRNFGHQAALITGLLTAASEADFVVTIDADGEQPVALIPELIEAWMGGAQIVHTQRRDSHELSRFKRLSSGFYYRLLRRVAHVPIATGMADFKLWDSCILRQIKDFLPVCESTRAFASWLAPGGPVIQFDQMIVTGRISRFSLRKMLHLAMGGLFRYMDWPLRFALIFGLCVTVMSGGLAAFAIVSHLAGKTVSGWTSIMVMIAFFGGINALLIGLLSEYLLRFSFRTSFPLAVIRPLPRVPCPINQDKSPMGKKGQRPADNPACYAADADTGKDAWQRERRFWR